MTSKIINLMVEHITNIYSEYGIELISVHDPDINIISEFSKSFRFRKQYEDYQFFKDTDMEKLKDNGHAVLMYNFGALELDPSKMNNIRFEAVFTNKTEPTKNMTRADLDDNSANLAEYIRNLNENPDFEVRDMILCDIPFEFKIISQNTAVMNNIQFIYLSRLKRNNKLETSIKFSEDTEPLELEYSTTFEPISDFSFVDRQQYGNLLQMDFSGKVNGAIFSSFSKTKKVLKEIIMTLDIN